MNVCSYWTYHDNIQLLNQAYNNFINLDLQYICCHNLYPFSHTRFHIKDFLRPFHAFTAHNLNWSSFLKTISLFRSEVRKQGSCCHSENLLLVASDRSVLSINKFQPLPQAPSPIGQQAYAVELPLVTISSTILQHICCLCEIQFIYNFGL